MYFKILCCVIYCISLLHCFILTSNAPGKVNQSGASVPYQIRGMDMDADVYITVVHPEHKQTLCCHSFIQGHQVSARLP